MTKEISTDHRAGHTCLDDRPRVLLVVEREHALALAIRRNGGTVRGHQVDVGVSWALACFERSRLYCDRRTRVNEALLFRGGVFDERAKLGDRTYF